MLRFFNSLGRKLEEFQPLVPNEVRMYCCGPTVYNYAHIGNFRANAFYDLVSRYLRYRGYQVTFVMNITDVDDKIIRAVCEGEKGLEEFTDYYLQSFLEDRDTLHIQPPDVLPRATGEIDSMVKMIEALLEKDFAYRVESGDIYFRIQRMSDYGKLAQIDTRQTRQDAAGRLNESDNYEKEEAADFALWKAWRESDGEVYWETSLGKGRPGWHIECSAMSTKYLGETFDIHCGGEDLVFPHHTNEIAQAECAHDKPYVRYWLHNAHLMVNGKKMSKSEGNFFTLRDLLERGHSPRTIRYELLKTHYRTPLDFREENMQQNARVLQRFDEFRDDLEHLGGSSGWEDFSSCVERSRAKFLAALDDDLNVSEALSAAFEFIKEVHREKERLTLGERDQALALLDEIDSVFGFVNPWSTGDVDDAERIEGLLAERRAAREKKDFQRADEIRDQLAAEGVVIKDTAQGTTWRKG